MPGIVLCLALRAHAGLALCPLPLLAAAPVLPGLGNMVLTIRHPISVPQGREGCWGRVGTY